jgi:hypothetical protein
LSTKGQNPATKELGKLHFRTASLGLIYKNSSLYQENKQALINFFGDITVKFNQSNPLVLPEYLYYIAGSFGNPEIVTVVSDQEVFDCSDLYSLDPQFTGVCHLLIKINIENNHICIRGFDNDPALLSQFFENG